MLLPLLPPLCMPVEDGSLKALTACRRCLLCRGCMQPCALWRERWLHGRGLATCLLVLLKEKNAECIMDDLFNACGSSGNAWAVQRRHMFGQHHQRAGHSNWCMPC